MRKWGLLLNILLVSVCAASAVEDCCVKRATWQESLIASREALLAKETAWDNQQFSKTGVKIGDWYYLAFKGSKRDFESELLKLESIDPGKPVEAGGKQYQLIKLPALTPGKVFNLAELINTEETKQLFLITSVTVPENMEKDTRVSLAVSATDMEFKIREGGSGWRQTKTRQLEEINSVAARISNKAGTYPAFCVVSIAKDTGPEFWYQPQVEKCNGVDASRAKRLEARADLFSKVRSAFSDPLSRAGYDLAAIRRLWPLNSDWIPGNTALITNAYKKDITELLSVVMKKSESLSKPSQERIKQLADDLKNSQGDSIADLSRQHLWANSMLELESLFTSLKSATMAVEHQVKVFDQYADGKNNLAELVHLGNKADEWLNSKLALDNPSSLESLIKLTAESNKKITSILLSNPLLKFEKLLVASSGMKLDVNWGGANTLGQKLEILSPVSPDGKLTTVYNGAVSSYELDWDAKKILFSDGTKILEMDVDGSNLRTIKGPEKGVDTSARYTPCRTPGGDILFVSTACSQVVPCKGDRIVANMHVVDKDGNNERRITFDQDHNWDPCVLNSGRILYTRWEYTDTPHLFTRLLMSMNPDGTDQKEYYGSASYWPNAMFWARPIPGHPSKFVTIVSGHHGSARAGELHLFDPALGRQEVDGSIQQIPGYGKKVKPRIEDNLVDKSWPKFITPYPLGTSPQKDGAGTYFLATVKMNENAPWRLCLVDIFDNITPILEGEYAMPVPMVVRKKPPVVPSRVNLEKKTGTAMIMDIYEGPGVTGFPKGSIKKLRVGTYHYRYFENSKEYASSHEGCWDIRRIMGTVPVDEDGSAFFEVPANMPIFVQPLDADGQALQVMRSWFTCQPGENLSCIGCHESQNMPPPTKVSTAMRKAPATIQPWNGPVRGYGFDREVQPVLDKRCVGCHDGKVQERPDFRAKRLHPNYKDSYSPAYMALQKYVRRAGLENDWHTPSPGEFQADTSHLTKMLKKGHYNVQLTRDEWDRIYTWIDFNIPYPAIWGESHVKPKSGDVDTRAKLLALYANINDEAEKTELPLPEIAQYEAPPEANVSVEKLLVDGWPIAAKDGGQRSEELDLGDNVKMKIVKIDAGKFIMGDPNGFADERPRIAEVKAPFFMGVTEVSLAQYKQFDPAHENKFVETRKKDVTWRGDFDMDSNPALPVVRISQEQALAFCDWLSRKTGRKVTLPTEEQWEWACRAGSDKTYNLGSRDECKGKQFMNIADGELKSWNYGRYDKDFSDGCRYTKPVNKLLIPNAWGLYDMHGNVAEWTTTDYKPLKDVGGASGTEQIPYKVVKGGSWNDLSPYATSASRWRYPKYQPVYDVGFRVVVE